MRVPQALYVVAVCAFLVSMLSAQDAVKADPTHYTIMSENENVRILKVHYGPHEKSVMHSHPATTAIFLTDGNAMFTFPDGKTQTLTPKAGEAVYTDAMTHLPENTGDQAFDVVLVELKVKVKPTKKQ